MSPPRRKSRPKVCETWSATSVFDPAVLWPCSGASTGCFSFRALAAGDARMVLGTHSLPRSVRHTASHAGFYDQNIQGYFVWRRILRQATARLVALSGELQRDLCRRHDAPLCSDDDFSSGNALARRDHSNFLPFCPRRFSLHVGPFPVSFPDICKGFRRMLENSHT
jgi:hypothetical protein